MITPKNEQSRATNLSVVLMIITSVHHLYGSVVYQTPWRAHVLFLSVPDIALNIIANRILQKDGFKTILFWANWLLILLASVLLIGIYEGIYNHILKNILFFSGIGGDLFAKLFPPPLYEAPNDAIFEATGIAQGVIAAFLIASFVKLTRTAMSGDGKINSI